MKTRALNRNLFFLTFFLTFLGFYTILLLLFNLGISETSRSVTIPLRLSILVMLVSLLWINRQGLTRSTAIGWYLVFAICFLARLFIEYNLEAKYYMPVSGVLLYFIAFSIFPFLGIVFQKLNKETLKTIFNTFLLGGALFSILAVISYKQFIGEVGRLTSGTVDEAVISPLALSYSSALSIGVMLFYLLGNKVSKIKKLVIFVIIGLSIIPFFLGASRGALVAVGVPLIIYFITGKSLKSFIKTFMVIILCIWLLIYLDTALNSGLLDRFLGITDAINEGESSAARTIIWKQSFSQFLENPIIGDSLAVKKWEGYPHNIFIETLQTTGVFGFIPLFIIVFKAFKVSLNIFKEHKELMWIAVIFIQALIQSMFSGAVYTAVWFWTSLGLIFATHNYIKIQKNNTNA